jgi:hypothetical protein
MAMSKRIFLIFVATITLIVIVACGSPDDGPSSAALPLPATDSPQNEVSVAQTTVASELGSMQSPRVSHSATVLGDGRVLLVGGMGDSFNPLRTAEIFDPTTLQWVPAGEMSRGRSEHAAVLLQDGRVMVTGGLDEDFDLVATTEIFDPKTGEWAEIAPMSISRSDHTATLLEDGRIMIAGGSIHPTVELYDPDTDEWTSSNP